MVPLFHFSLHNQSIIRGKVHIVLSVPFPNAIATALAQALITFLWNYCTRRAYLPSVPLTITSHPP